MVHSPTSPPKDLRADAAIAARAAGARRATIEAGRALYPRFWALDLVPMRASDFERQHSDLAIEVAREGVVLYG